MASDAISVHGNVINQQILFESGLAASLAQTSPLFHPNSHVSTEKIATSNSSFAYFQKKISNFEIFVLNCRDVQYSIAILLLSHNK